MAATLTQERFTGPEWIFERKFDGIRLLAFKNGADVKLYSRNRLPQHYPSVADAIALLPVGKVILDGEAAWDPASRIAYHVFDILWLEGRSVMTSAARRAPGIAERVFVPGSAGTRSRSPRRQALGTRMPRRMGRSDRETSHVNLRAPPFAALAEDEVRSVAGAGRRRIHGSAGQPRRSGSVARRILRWRGLCLCRKDRHGVRQQNCCSTFAHGSTSSKSRSRRSRKAKDCRASATHWVQPEIVVQVAFIEWTTHGKLRHPRLLAIRNDKSPREVVRETW